MSKGSFSAAELKVFDNQAKELGFTERLLIENASSNLTTFIERKFPEKKILIVAGWGNNGADALSAARKLIAKGFDVEIVQLLEREANKEVIWQKDILSKLKIAIEKISSDNIDQLKKLLNEVDVIVEGILGIGISKNVGENLKNVITVINESNKIIIACDIPSGLHPDTGKIMAEAIRAQYTVSFIGAKKGFFLDKGPECCGEIHVTDIGISLEQINKVKP